jgi:hypothetical protein
MEIAVLVPMCSRNQPWKTLEDCFFFQHLFPSFRATKSPDHHYTFYLGIDDDDAFFRAHAPELAMMGFKVIYLTGCQHAPAFAWNRLFQIAGLSRYDYYFQIGDDVVIESRGWTERFIKKLAEHNNVGVVGPCNPVNFFQRKHAGQPIVIENSFVHAKHYELFQTFFHPNIRNWYCDDWITQIYQGTCSYTCEDIIVRNRCVDNRYDIQVVERLPEYVAEGRAKIRSAIHGCFSFCLFGPQTDKYYTGLAKNVDIIHQKYPNWDIRVYVSPEAELFVRSLRVTCIPTGQTGFANVLHRFKSVLDKSYDVVCVRDTDSRIHERDEWCINDFLDSPARVYTIRDHPWHTYRIMGGLWGAKRGGAHFDLEELTRFCAENPMQYTADTTFLDKHLELAPMTVYSYRTDGVLGLPNESVRVIEPPIVDDAFCGNVMLFREDGEEFYEFKHT